MAKYIKANTKMTRNTDSGRLVGPMVGSMSGNGRRVSSMVGGSIICPIRVRRWGSGWKGRGLSGYRIISDFDLSEFTIGQ